jgi:hypothetical protein
VHFGAARALEIKSKDDLSHKSGKLGGYRASAQRDLLNHLQKKLNIKEIINS